MDFGSPMDGIARQIAATQRLNTGIVMDGPSSKAVFEHGLNGSNGFSRIN
jgi:hypothetical protein